VSEENSRLYIAVPIFGSTRFRKCLTNAPATSKRGDPRSFASPPYGRLAWSPLLKFNQGQRKRKPLLPSFFSLQNVCRIDRMTSISLNLKLMLGSRPRRGCRENSRTSAATPAAIGVENEVPVILFMPLFSRSGGYADRTSSPGAVNLSPLLFSLSLEAGLNPEVSPSPINADYVMCSRWVHHTRRISNAVIGRCAKTRTCFS